MQGIVDSQLMAKAAYLHTVLTVCVAASTYGRGGTDVSAMSGACTLL